MEVKIGVQHAPRELIVETDATPDAVHKAFEKALAGDGLLALSDTRGREVLVPARSIAYLEVGSGVSGQVGFRG
jgi:Protein of unknown function (DUF3107)